MKYRTTDKQTVDQIVFQYYGNRPGATEMVLEANPGLAEHGAFLPSGLLIELPDYQTLKPRQQTRLWD